MPSAGVADFVCGEQEHFAEACPQARSRGHRKIPSLLAEAAAANPANFQRHITEPPLRPDGAAEPAPPDCLPTGATVYAPATARIVVRRPTLTLQGHTRPASWRAIRRPIYAPINAVPTCLPGGQRASAARGDRHPLLEPTDRQPSRQPGQGPHHHSQAAQAARPPARRSRQQGSHATTARILATRINGQWLWDPGRTAGSSAGTGRSGRRSGTGLDGAGTASGSRSRCPGRHPAPALRP